MIKILINCNFITVYPISFSRKSLLAVVFCYNKIMKFNKKYIIAGLVTLIGITGGLFTGAKIFSSNNTEVKTNTEIVLDDYKIELSVTPVDTLIETEEGEIEVEQYPTIESVDGGNVSCEGEEECGLGSYVYAPTESYTKFKDYTLGKCFNTDGYYGAQCWDLGDLFWQNYAGRNLSTCGTGGAKGAWLCKEQNAGEEFDLIYDKTQLQAGDWVIFNGGQFGHVGMALGSFNNGYVALLGQNQGGTWCEGGGSSTNIINISLKDFAGAFRPKTYEKPEPSPSPVPDIPISGCDIWNVEEGDTMSGIMLACENTVVYGDAMDAYAKTWYSLKVKPEQSVYDGWNSESGVGLYTGDDIEHRTK